MNEHLASCETVSIFFLFGVSFLEVLKPFGKVLYINLIRHISQAPQNEQVEEHQPCVRVIGTLPYPTPHPEKL